MTRRSALWVKHHVRSGFEKRIRDLLDLELGISFKYEDRKFKYVKKLCKHCGEVVDYGTYTPDFNFYGVGGEYLFTVEAKGKFDGADRKKMLAVRTAHPEIDLRILFQRDQPLCKGSKSKYSDWATKNNFNFYFGTAFPIEWINDAKGR